MPRLDFWASLSCISLPKMVGTICHDTPYLSCSQPHCCVAPPSESFAQNVSTSSWVSQFTTNDTAGEKLNFGPPFSARNSCPSSWNAAALTGPFGPGPAAPQPLVASHLQILENQHIKM